jgi:hypothetical protein
MRRVMLISLVLAVITAGCGPAEVTGGADPGAAQPAPQAPSGGPSEAQTGDDQVWRAPADHEYVLESSCGERNGLGRYRVAVRDGAVADVAALDDTARRSLDGLGSHQFPSLDGLLDEVRTARDRGADVAEVTVDPDDGHPTAIEIDHDTDALDDEVCYRITGYVAGGP